MSERKDWARHWIDLYNSIHIVNDEECRTRAKPTDQQLNEIETSLRCRLPLSYREFVKVFGQGRAGYSGQNIIDSGDNNTWQADEAKLRVDSERIARSIAFGSFQNDYFIWSPPSEEDPGSPEPKIYFVPKWQTEPASLVTDSFDTFIEDYCLNGHFWKLLGMEIDPFWEDEETGELVPRRCFECVGY
jgi:hypothetical protein